MGDFLSQEPFRSLATTSIGAAVLLAIGRLVQLVIERRVPSTVEVREGERLFRDDLMERVTALEKDRDQLTRDTIEAGQKYWELYGKYCALEQQYKTLAAANVELQKQHAHLLGEYRKVRKRLETLTQLEEDAAEDKV